MHPSKFFPVVVPETGPRGIVPQLVLPEVYDKAMKERQDEIGQAFRTGHEPAEEPEKRSCSKESSGAEQPRKHTCFPGCFILFDPFGHLKTALDFHWQDRIHSCFKDWLQSTGKVRQLSDLAKLAGQNHQRQDMLPVQLDSSL